MLKKSYKLFWQKYLDLTCDAQMEEARGLWYWARTFLEQLVAMILANIFGFFDEKKNVEKFLTLTATAKWTGRDRMKREMENFYRLIGN